RRGQVTAREVADELEVSERTARRDLDALGQAGLPVYSQQGRSGGWRMVGGGRTDLSGLTAAEAIIADKVDRLRAPLVVRALADPGKVGLLRMLLGLRIRIGPPGPGGRVEVEIRGHGPEAVAADIAGLGSWVEVLDPPSVRHRLAVLGGELTSLYA
ncbi:MAG: HTH domain-containing protein, partial [Acidimicrobiales bacterium]